MSSTAASRSDAAPPPAELVVRLDDDVLVRDGGRLLCGGTPARLLRLSPAGAAHVARWRAGAAIGPGRAPRALARRLLDAGLLVAVPAPRPLGDGEVVAIVPTRDRAGDLARCLAALAHRSPAVARVVVDDGSRDAAAVRAVAERFGARLVRLSPGRGPGAARNAGAAATSEPLIAFVDSDVVVTDGWLERLAAHFGDPAVGAVAPRVGALEDGPGALARYEAARSSLDMGERAGAVGAGRAVPYVPSATVVVRRAAFGAGFDAGLATGEDVDLVWRMTAAGWRVRYDPAAVVLHDHRVRPLAFARRRLAYARSIGPLARRHPDALRPMRADAGGAAIVALLVLRRPALAALPLAARTWSVRRRVRGRAERPTRLAVELTARTLAGTAHGASHAVRRVWSPVLLLAALRHRRAARLLALAWVAQRLDPRAPALRQLPLAVADDLLAALGTWIACARHRTLAPLLPAVEVRRGRRARAG